MRKQSFGILLFLLLSAPLFAQRDSLPRPAPDTATPAFTRTGRPATGLATLYDTDLDGMKTASGETFFHARLTVAANLFPLNTWLLVTNPKNGKSVVVRVNDRLTKKQSSRNAIVSLSKTAADSLGIAKAYSIKVKLESILPIDSLSFNKYYDLDSGKGDSSATAKRYRPAGKAQTGIASYYSASLDGTLTSTGERYRNYKMTAASNHFKLNTWVEVTNLRNNKSVVVRINDRMHPRMKQKGRVVDMSQEAARILDYMEAGLTKVRVQPVELVKDTVPAVGDSIVINLDSLRAIDSLKRIDTISLEPEPAGITGIASFYSAKFDGRKTSTGAIFRNSGMTAASNDFALNTWVRVTNLVNDRSVVVKINDRMHKKMQQKGRVVDLSRAAARKLGFINAGLARVRVEPVDADTRE